MNITDYHAKYFAHELNRTGGNGIDRLGRALFDACVDLNPHQIEAALFALRSPLSKGVLLADEVGLGKTIEAGIVLCQYWAERRRHILIICPASLRKQWAIELNEKFNLPSEVIDAKTYKDIQKSGIANPFRNNSIIICSMHYAGRKAEELKEVPWDLVVIDEAHKLRNAYRQSNRIGQRIRWATEDRKKILLTATPLQNSLLELYGLATLIDENLFGDLPSFRTQYINFGGDTEGLRDRIQSFCWRSLRSQVLEYIRFTERKLLTRPFKPTEQEHKLYESISTYLKRDDTFALPSGQRHLLILIVRKVLASSPHAVAGTLEIMRNRLITMREDCRKSADFVERLIQYEEIDDDLLDEILEDEEDFTVEVSPEVQKEIVEAPKKINIEKLDKEIEELDDYIRWANSIGVDTKTQALIKALDIGFVKMAEMQASSKAIIFTESRRTQEYLKGFLEANGYAGRVLMFNGTNRDADSASVYENWLELNRDTGKISGSRAIDIRTAIIDCFQNSRDILIATEAAAEGINLQFCSLVINFDLPWNPQRIEQRIGRCHRYGQKHDVVVINFLNERNEADRRVYQLLEQKFNLFTGIFGASDDVLGSIESGVDFERRVLDIYQECRTPDEIEAAFALLQSQLDEQIQTKMKDTRRMLLEHFDEDVHERLKVNLSGTQEQLDRIGRMFWSLTKHMLSEKADFDDQKLSFNLLESPIEKARPGLYHLISKEQRNVPGDFLYRINHPLGEHVVYYGLQVECLPAEVVFDYENHHTRIAVIEKLKGKRGWMRLERLIIDSFEREEYLLFSALDDTGKNIDQETCKKLFNCSASVVNNSISSDAITQRLSAEVQQHTKATISRSLEANNQHFNEAREKLEKWADDLVLAAEKALKDTKEQIKLLQRQARLANNLDEQHDIQQKIQKLEKQQRRQRQEIFQVEDQIIEKRDALIDSLQRRLTQKTESEQLFTIKWSVV